MDEMYGDQYIPDMRTTIDDIDLPFKRDDAGFYEDKFRHDQYGSPATLGCGVKNPYIQDGLTKHPRFNPIRTKTVPERHNELLARSEPAHNMPLDYYQRTVRMPGEFHSQSYPVNCSAGCGHGCGNSCGKEGFVTTSGNEPVKTSEFTMTIVFVFLLLVFIASLFWGSINYLKCKINDMGEKMKNPQM